MFKKIHFILNPAAGQDEPILSYINKAFLDTEVDWEILITKKADDALKMAKALIGKTDLVAVYGGDGSVMEVAQALFKTKVPMAIIPGGTANVMAKELGIPTDSQAALALLTSENSQIKAIDMGLMNHIPFMLRVNMGLLADMVIQTDRRMKDTFGQLAYGISTVQTLLEVNQSTYLIEIDGEIFEESGVALSVTNSGNIGVEGFSILPDINVSDGLLDVILMNQSDWLSVVKLAGSTLFQTETDVLKRWKGRDIKIAFAEPQNIICDDCVMENIQKLHVKIVPESLNILIPTLQKNL
jgi:diacylglycerol kinase (ATP)